jgi:hypothetical protein
MSDYYDEDWEDVCVGGYPEHLWVLFDEYEDEDGYLDTYVCDRCGAEMVEEY